MPQHRESRHLPYSAQQMFDLVADVGRYPEFLPWCVGARVISGDEKKLVADLTIGFKMFRETFRSQVTLERPHHVHVRYLNGPFRYLNNHWRFRPVPQPGGVTGCEVDFFVDFEFRNPILGRVIGVVFSEAMHRIVRAFQDRAAKLYG